jgi:hypothetical protein
VGRPAGLKLDASGHATGVVKRQRRRAPAKDQEQLPHAAGMTVRAHVGTRLEGVAQPLDRVLGRGVQVEVLAPAPGRRGLGAEPAQAVRIEPLHAASRVFFLSATFSKRRSQLLNLLRQ